MKQASWANLMRDLIVLLSFAITIPTVVAQDKISADVVVYGATPAGISAAIAAADDQRTVVLIEPTSRIGGLVTSGLSHTDFHNYEGLSGFYLQFSKLVEADYRKTYGEDSMPLKECVKGTHAEPKVNQRVFESMLAARPKIQLIRAGRLVDLERKQVGEKWQITSIQTRLHDRDQTQSIYGKIYIDATYEGDLMAKAGVPYQIGREGKKIYNESLAPDESDQQLQGYNFRLIMTDRADLKVDVQAPKSYRREDYLGVLPLLTKGKIDRVIGTQSQKAIYKVQEPGLPNGKHDINDMSRGLVRLSLPGENQAWPDGDPATRQKIFDEHLRWNVGLLYFLQSDEAVPESYRLPAKKWGFCKDEFVETNHLPPQLYVREARRMQGVYIYTQKDVVNPPDDARAPLHRDSIAMGEYGPNCHGTSHEGSRFGGKHTGEFYLPVPPYQIPYGCLVPKNVKNLLVPGAVSSSHVGFCALRLEPIWMNLGQASGHASHLAIAHETDVQSISVGKLQSRLHEMGSATIYFSDIPGDHPHFRACQWWGNAGGFHGLYPPAKNGPRGKNLIGQYYDVYPNHAAELDLILTKDLEAKWLKLATALKLDLTKLPQVNQTTTRGDWLRVAYQLKK